MPPGFGGGGALGAVSAIVFTNGRDRLGIAAVKGSQAGRKYMVVSRLRKFAYRRQRPGYFRVI